MLDYGDLRGVLPHGPSMVLIDRVDRLDPGRSVRAIKAVSGSEQCYAHLAAGLPKRRYAYPVSLLLESFGQAAAILWHSREGTLVADDTLLMFAAARHVEFMGDAYPGDVVVHEVRLEHSVARTGFVSGEMFVAERRIATVGSLVAVVRPAPAAPGLAPAG